MTLYEWTNSNDGEGKMKRIALINDLSGFGKCSLTAAIPVISVMGMQACPLPTAVLTAQTGFEEYFCDDYTDKMDIFTDQWKKLGMEFDGIYSGFLADSRQIEKVCNFLEQFKKSDTLYLADPVMGDHGKPYDMFSEDFLQGMRILVQKADVITPNLTELCMLADVDYEEMTARRGEPDYLQRVQAVCERLQQKNMKESGKKQTIVVTGIVRTRDNQEYIGNLAVSERECFHIENPYTGMGFSGTGDLFASVICGSLVKGLSVRKAMEKASYFLQEAIEEASAEQIPAVHGVHFEKYLSRLL